MSSIVPRDTEKAPAALPPLDDLNDFTPIGEIIELNFPDKPLATLSHDLEQAGQDQKARGKVINKALEALGELAPEFATIIDDAALRVRRQYKRTQESDHKRVIYSLEHGATTLDEINEDTDIPKKDLKRILNDLMMIDRVEMRTTRDGHHKSGRGGTVAYYFLINSASFSKNIGRPKDMVGD